MPKSTSKPALTSARSAKVPPSLEHAFADGRTRAIQVNYCKNPRCANYGVPASLKKWARRAKAASGPGTEYTISATRSGQPSLRCLLCGEYLPMKSNVGISEELSRISRYATPAAAPCCPKESCLNREVPISRGTEYYYSKGKTDQGSKRYTCRACGSSFSVRMRATLRQRYPQKNHRIFSLLMNKVPFSRICEVLGISHKTLYQRIDFIHRQCLAFASAKERQLLNGVAFRSMYLAVDRQGYAVNWSQRKDKRNVVLSAIGTADLTSGYVFGMHLNFDGAFDTEEVEDDAKASGDYSTKYPFRKYARLWLKPDYDQAVKETAERLAKRGTPGAAIGDRIAGQYKDAEARSDVESSEEVTEAKRFPKRGMQVRSEYTMYAHFFWLRELLRGTQKVRFFMDQESGIRAACLAAFEHEVKERRCEAFYVRIAKELTITERRKVIAESRKVIEAVQAANPSLSAREAEILMMKGEMARASKLGKWNDRWLRHPFPNAAEPDKAVCYLTDHDHMDEDRLARLYLRASLHAIDRFFNQVRRRLSLLERPIGTSSSSGRTWHGYSAYQPDNIEKVLDIFRVFYNYCLNGKDGKTPAMRLGVMHTSLLLEDLLQTLE